MRTDDVDDVDDEVKRKSGKKWPLRIHICPPLLLWKRKFLTWTEEPFVRSFMARIKTWHRTLANAYPNAEHFFEPETLASSSLEDSRQKATESLDSTEAPEVC